jgi:hypothetical protein
LWDFGGEVGGEMDSVSEEEVSVLRLSMLGLLEGESFGSGKCLHLLAWLMGFYFDEDLIFEL